MNQKLYRTVKRNFWAFFFHGIFLNIAGVFSQITTIQSSFVYLLTGSSLLSGALFTANRIGLILPQMFFAPIIQRRHFKKIFLLLAVLIRAVSWLIIGLLTFFWGQSHPGLVTVMFFALTLLFFLAGGMGDVTYYDVFAKSIPVGIRGKLFGWRFFVGGLLSIAAGYLTKIILGASPDFFRNYGYLFLLTSLGLFIAFFGFYSLKEPPGQTKTEKKYLRRIFAVVKKDTHFLKFILTEFLLSASMMLYPFYVIYAKEELHLPLGIIGLFVTLQVIGQIVSGPVLGKIGDKYNFRLVLVLVGAVSFLLPLFAFFLPHIHPYAFTAIFFFIGITFRGLVLGTSNYLMEFAPAGEIPTYVAIKNTLLLPTVLFPLFGGVFIDWWGYDFLFALVFSLTFAGTLLGRKLVCVRKIVSEEQRAF